MDITTLQEHAAVHFAENIKARQQVAEVLAESTTQAAELLLTRLADGGRSLVYGDDDSAAGTQHFAAEITGRFEKECMKLAAVALTTDTFALTAIGSDYGFEHIFGEQVRTLGCAGDMLVGTSTSGNFANVIEAVKAAHERGMRVIALIRRDGGKIAAMLQDSDILLSVPYSCTARIQENHILLIHAVCDCIGVMLLEGM